MKLDTKIFKQLKELQNTAMKNIDEQMAQCPEEHKAFFKPYISAIKKGENIDINSFSSKMKEYASRNNGSKSGI